MHIPIPRNCPECRHVRRFEKRGPNKLWQRSCMCNKKHLHHKEGKCEIEFETSYAPDPRYAKGSGEASRSEIVYCEKCYQSEVY